MIKRLSRDRSGERLMQQFLTLPVLLGALLLLNGAVGIYATRHLRNDLGRLNDTALGPTLALNAIVDSLHELSLNLLRLNQAGVRPEDQARLVTRLKSGLKKISSRVKTQADASQGLAYEGYLKKWVTSW